MLQEGSYKTDSVFRVTLIYYNFRKFKWQHVYTYVLKGTVFRLHGDM